MRRVIESKFIDSFSPTPFGQRGWVRSKLLSCPECGRSDKFGINLGSGVVHCFYDSFKQPLSSYLKNIGREDLLVGERTVRLDFSLKTLIDREKEKESFHDIILPPNFKRVYSDPYLDERNFLDRHYELFQPGYSSDPNFRDYIIFQVYQDGKLRGYQCRSKKSKEWHKYNLEQSKQRKTRLKLRYKDMPGMDTSRLLGGFDDLTDKVATLILVEGLFDKVGVDKKLDLYSTDDVRCCFTFGNNIVSTQVDLIKRFSNLREIYLLYDSGTIQTSKQAALLLSKYFNVRVNVMGKRDPGDATRDEILDKLNLSVSAISFFLNKLNKI